MEGNGIMMTPSSLSLSLLSLSLSPSLSPLSPLSFSVFTAFHRKRSLVEAKKERAGPRTGASRFSPPAARRDEDDERWLCCCCSLFTKRREMALGDITTHRHSPKASRSTCCCCRRCCCRAASFGLFVSSHPVAVVPTAYNRAPARHKSLGRPEVCGRKNALFLVLKEMKENVRHFALKILSFGIPHSNRVPPPQ